MRKPSGLLFTGFLLVLAGAVLPFLIILDVLPSTFTLNFLAFTSSMLGMFLAVIGVAMYVGNKRRQPEDDWYEQ